MSTFPSLLNVLRRRADLTQLGLANKAGVSQSIVSLIENDTQKVTPESEKAVAEALGYKGEPSDLRMSYEEYLKREETKTQTW